MIALAALCVAAAFTRPLERVSTLDPAQARSLYDSRAIRLVFETPLEIDYAARPYRLAPCYCEMPSVSADGRVYTLATRAGRSARDAARALERLRDPNDVSPNGWIVRDVDTIRTPDDRTLEIRLKRPVSYFPWLLSMTATAVRDAQGAGTGPYRLQSWRKNHAMTFVRRTPAANRFDTVRYLVVDDPSTQWLMFLRGELDMLGEISRDNWDSVVGRDGRLDPRLAAQGIALHTAPSLEMLYLGFNMRDRIVGSNRPLRQALNAAFDFPTWRAFNNGRVIAADGPLPPGVEGRLETPFAYRYDLARAKCLMAEAGYPDGIDPKTGRRLVLELAVGRPNQESRESCELTAAFYAKLGIRLEMRFFTWDAFLKAVNEGRVQMYRMGWVADYPHAQNFLQLFYSKNASPGVNHGNYANKGFDAAYEREDWKTCQEIVREDCPWVFTHVNVTHSLVGPHVGNYIPGAFADGSERYYEAK